MRYASYALLAVVVIVAAVIVYLSFSTHDRVTPTADERGKPAVTVVLTDDGFQPRDLRISKGTTVTFTTTRDNRFWPASNPHPAHSIYPQFDPLRPVETNESWSFIFENLGAWYYHDHIRSYFTGVIYVEN